MKRTKPTMPNEPMRITPIPWYTREDFANIKAIALDAQNLHTTWEEWLIDAEFMEKQCQRKGELVFRAHMTALDLRNYCAARALHIDGTSRAHYASFIAVEFYKNH